VLDTLVGDVRPGLFYGCGQRFARLLFGFAQRPQCEEKSSGIDKVVGAAELYQLPAPDFRAGLQRTMVTIFGPRPFDKMDRDDRIRACYQHCALKWVMAERMTNQSLRERFHLAESKSASVFQVIAATMEAKLIKPDEKVGASRKYARYLPFWA
jgi:predicted HTH transcriptional regulator